MRGLPTDVGAAYPRVVGAPRRNAVRVALYCTHPDCGEDAATVALRDQDGFTLTLPRGWARVREDLVRPDAPQWIPALCPAHRPNPRMFIARSMGEMAKCDAATGRGKKARDIRIRLARYASIIETWRQIAPTEEQLAAMVDLIVRMRVELGLPRGLRSGFVRKKGT
jgi:hypothetical protein